MTLTTVAVGGWLAALTVCDLRAQRLPNALTLPGAAVILGLATVTGAGTPALAGALALAGPYLCLHLLAPASMGAGDVKLAVGLGALTATFGPQAWLLAALGAPLATLLWALVRRRRRLPHGPAMCLASAVAMVLG